MGQQYSGRTSEAVEIAGKTVHRLGFGAMRVVGPGVWGEPADPSQSIKLLRRVVELGVDFIDTASVYGPHVSEHLIREALHPYPGHLLITTKGGQTQPCLDPPSSTKVVSPSVVSVCLAPSPKTTVAGLHTVRSSALAGVLPCHLLDQRRYLRGLLPGA